MDGLKVSLLNHALDSTGSSTGICFCKRTPCLERAVCHTVVSVVALGHGILTWLGECKRNTVNDLHQRVPT